MASDQSFVTFVCDQMAGAGEISFKKMFGEYAVYCGGRMIALICDNKLFIKPSVWAQTGLAGVQMAPPYPQAKPCYWIVDGLDDAVWLSKVAAATAREMPLPKPKKAAKSR